MNAIVTALLVALALSQTARPTASSLAGIVTAESQQPVAGAIVTVRGNAPILSVTTITGDDGTFLIEQLPAGRYVVAVTKPAYLATTYGATRANSSGTPIALVAGERRTGLSIVLARGAVIAGTVRDETGAAAATTTVNIYRTHSGPRSTVERLGSIETDDRGEFRFFGLEPGDYLVSAAVPTSDSSPIRDDAVDAALDALRHGVRAPIDGIPRPPVEASRTSLAQIFYPGTAALADASAVSVAAGDERRVDIALQRVTLSSIRGLVSGAPPGRRPSVELGEADGLQSRTGSMVTQVQTDDAGRFQFTGLAPGMYRVSSRTDAPAPAPANGQVETIFIGASAEIRVDSDAAAEIVLDLQPTLTLRGAVQTTSTSRVLPQMRIGLLDAAVPGEPWRYGANPDADRSFALTNALPGRYLADVRLDEGPTSAWHVVSATIDGHDALDVPFEISAESEKSERLVVTLSDAHTTLSGHLEVAPGRVASGFQIVAFASDEALRTSARRVRAERVASDGTFSLQDLPAGDYFIGVVTADFHEDFRAPDVLRQLEAVAVRVTMREGQSVTQNLRIR